jgi:hypothetical protein
MFRPSFRFMMQLSLNVTTDSNSIVYKAGGLYPIFLSSRRQSYITNQPFPIRYFPIRYFPNWSSDHGSSIRYLHPDYSAIHGVSPATASLLPAAAAFRIALEPRAYTLPPSPSPVARPSNPIPRVVQTAVPGACDEMEDEEE